MAMIDPNPAVAHQGHSPGITGVKIKAVLIGGAGSAGGNALATTVAKGQAGVERAAVQAELVHDEATVNELASPNGGA